MASDANSHEGAPSNGNTREVEPPNEDGTAQVKRDSSIGQSGAQDGLHDFNSGASDNLTADDNDSTLLHTVFSKRMRNFLVAMTMMGTIFSPFSSFSIIPALDILAKDYNTSLNSINFAVTVFQVMQALTPMIFAEYGDQMGRRPAYILAFIVYLAANIGLALQSDYAALLILRGLQSTGSSGTVALGNGVLADFATPAERGSYISYVQSVAMFAPAIAPIIGGVLTQYLGWRSIFWFLAITSGVYLVAYFCFVPETCRKVVANGSVPPSALCKSPVSGWQWRRKVADMERNGKSADDIPLPMKLSKTKLIVPDIVATVRIIFEKDIAILMLLISMFITANYCLLVPLQNIIRKQYNLSTVQVGLCYIPFSVGSVGGAITTGKLLNWNYKRVARSIGVTPDRKRGDDLRNFPIERARIGLMWPPTLLACAIVCAWGWVLASGTSLAVPLVLMFFCGACLAAAGGLNSLLVDLYPSNPSRVTASLNLCRATMSAVGTAVVQYIIDAWGYGWTYVFIGLLLLACSPIIWISQKWGPQWREERYLRLERIANEPRETSDKGCPDVTA